MVFVRSDRPRLRSLLAGAALLAALAGAGCASGQDERVSAPVPGVTDEPCPKAVNPDHGCIYLGIISDLTVGPFTGLGVPMVTARRAFWDRVNRQVGIAGYVTAVPTSARENKYDPAAPRPVFRQITG